MFDKYATAPSKDGGGGEGVIERATVERILDDTARVTGSDRDAVARQLFGLLDDDGDGIVTFDEFRMAFDMHPVEMVQFFGPDDALAVVAESMDVFAKHNHVAGGDGTGTLSTTLVHDIVSGHLGDDADVGLIRQVADSILTMLGADADASAEDDGSAITLAGFTAAYLRHPVEIRAVFAVDPHSANSSRVEPEEDVSESPVGRSRSAFEFEGAVEEGKYDELLQSGDGAGGGDGDADSKVFEGMSKKKYDALCSLFKAADLDGGGSIGAEELHHVLADEQLGGDLAHKMRSSFATFSQRFMKNMMKRLDRDGDGHFDFREFAVAFSPVIDDNGEYMPEASITGAQLYALQIEYKLLEEE